MDLTASEGEYFYLSGPFHLTSVDWDNAYHRMSVAASLVQGVYVLERDRQANRAGLNALAPPWWTSFDFQLFGTLIDDDDKSIFGAIYEFKRVMNRSPRYVIAFRGTLTKPDSVCRDIKMDMHLTRNGLHQKPHSQIAIQAAQNKVAALDDSNIWLAGHSLGSAIAMLTGKEMGKNGKKTMEDIGARGIERLATQNSIRDLVTGAFGKESEAVHLIPSASLTFNVTTPVQDFKEDHGIHQWWRPT